MTLNDYQASAARTINTSLPSRDVEHHALHEIASECGEIHGIFQKTYQGHMIDDDELRLEIGDLLWGIAELCTARGWSLDDVANLNIEKLRKRYPKGFDVARSVHRAEYESEAKPIVD